MVYRKIFSLLMLSLFSTGIFAQTADTGEKVRRHAIKSNVLGIFTLFYEQKFTDNLSFQTGLQYNPNSISPKKYTTASIAPEIKYYFFTSKNKLNGLFAGGYGKYKFTDFDGISESKTAALGLNFGYQYIFRSGIVTEAFIGGGYNVWKKESSNFPKDNKYDIRMGISIGYSF